ncbi:MAG: hypothetical protein KBD76_05980 [Bacteriovorax sp.]|nr:hypothetical protein [Bacteriovorax sp.]
MKKSLQLIILLSTILTSSRAFSDDCYHSMKLLISRSEMKHKSWAEVEVAIDVKTKFQSRYELGEITKKQLEKLLLAVDSYKKTTNESLLGPGMNACFQEFSDEAASSLAELITRTYGAKDSKSAFDKLISGAQDIFGDTATSAKSKICALSDVKGTRCQIFSKSIARHCK